MKVEKKIVGESWKKIFGNFGAAPDPLQKEQFLLGWSRVKVILLKILASGEQPCNLDKLLYLKLKIDRILYPEV